MPVSIATNSPTHALERDGAPDQGEGCDTHDSFEGDVHNARAFGKNAAQRREGDGGRDLEALGKKVDQEGDVHQLTSFLRRERTARIITALIATMNRIIRPWIAYVTELGTLVES